MSLEQNYGIELPCVALYGRVWPCMILSNLVWCLVALYGFIICIKYCGLISPFLAVIDPNSFVLVNITDAHNIVNYKYYKLLYVNKLQEKAFFTANLNFQSSSDVIF